MERIVAVKELLAAGARQPEIIYVAVTPSRGEHDPYSQSKINSMDYYHVIFETYYDIENYSLSLIYRVVIKKRGP
jgi:hypothetical protein